VRRPSGVLVVAQAELLHQLVTPGIVPEEPLDLLAEGRHVAERALERVEGRAQFQQLAHLGHLVRDGLGLEVRELLELQVQVHLRALLLRETLRNAPRSTPRPRPAILPWP